MKGKHFKNSNAKHIALTIMALLTILIVGAGITYSWIEGGDQFYIRTPDDTNVKTATIPTNVTVEQGVTLDPQSSNAAISMSDHFDRTANNLQDLYFAPVSSNGESFYFPTKFSSGNPTAYRASDTNDVGTKYINYSFKTYVARKSYVAFESAPVFKVDGVTNTTDTGAFRIMIKDTPQSGTAQKKILKIGSGTTDTVVTNTSGSTTTTTVESVDNYIKNDTNSNKIFDYSSAGTHTYEVSIWLQGTDVTNANLLGKNIDVDLNLKSYEDKYTVTFSASTATEHGGAVTADSFTGGYIKVGGVTKTAKYTNDYLNGTSVSINAVAYSGYTFRGWYKDASCTTTIDTNYQTASRTMTISSSNTKFYAKFEANPAIVFSACSADTNGGDVLVNSFTGGSIKVGGTTYTEPLVTTQYTNGSSVSISATAADGYTFKGWYKDMDCTVTIGTTYLTANQTVTVSTSNNYFYAKFEANPTHKVTVSRVTTPSGQTGGTVSVNGNNSSPTASSPYSMVKEGSTVTIVATPASSNYRFIGWYTDSACTTAMNGNYTNATQTFTAGTSDVTYYAKFIRQYTVTVYAVTDGTLDDDVTGGTVKAGSSAAGVSSSAKVDYGSSITLSGTTASASYSCDGFYTAATGGSQLTSLATYTITSVSSNLTYYVRFTSHAVTTSIYFEDRTGFTNYYAYVYNSDDGNTHYSDDFAGTLAPVDEVYETGLHVFSFDTTDTGQFRVIVSSSSTGTNQYPGQNEPGLEGDIGKDYLFKANNTLVEFDPTENHEITLVSKTGTTMNSTTGGTCYIGTTGTSSKLGTYGTTATFYATAKTGYQFVGFYDSDGNLMSENSIWETKITEEDIDYYAWFRLATTFYIEPRSGYSNYHLYVYDSNNTKYNGDWNEDTLTPTYDSKSGCYKLTFFSDTGSTSTTIYAIVHNGSGTQYPTSGGLSGYLGNTYIFKSGSPTALSSVSTATTVTSLASNSTISNKLIFNMGTTPGSIWYWEGSGNGSVKKLTNYTSGTATISTYTTSASDPKAIGLSYTGTSTSWPGDSYKITGNITKSSSITYNSVYYTDSTSNSTWKAFTHITPSCTVGATSTSSASINDVIKIQGSASGTLSSSGNNKFTYYVTNGSTKYRLGSADTTDTSVYWKPTSTGTWYVYVAVKDRFGLETKITSSKSIVIS